MNHEEGDEQTFSWIWEQWD